MDRVLEIQMQASRARDTLANEKMSRSSSSPLRYLTSPKPSLAVAKRFDAGPQCRDLNPAGIPDTVLAIRVELCHRLTMHERSLHTDQTTVIEHSFEVSQYQCHRSQLRSYCVSNP